jgi:Ran GTPase-activating protein (RanGAP) involved in mRNA processing and transport
LHDNWIKGEAIDRLVEFILKARTLEILNVSDSTMGTEGALLLANALQNSKCKETLKHFACNYNEIESGKVSRRILDILLSFPALQVVEFKGNTLGKKAA